MTFEELKTQIESSGRQYDVALITLAYELAHKSHEGQMRESGEPYITHPLSVASLLVDLGLDTESVCAALLHDVVEDTGVTLDEIKSKFGDDVTELVDGVTKLGRIPFSSVEEQQAENLRKLLFAMSKDIRVMIVKMCDRLHNMRTLEAKGGRQHMRRWRSTRR
ncbi:MAG: HD domain-containing protein [Oscillospiraceae bacterium]